MRHKTTAVLVIIAALLAVDVVLRVQPREAAGQGGPPLRIVNISATWDTPFRRELLYRAWSDGVIEQNQRRAGGENPQWRGWEVVPEVPAP